MIKKARSTANLSLIERGGMTSAIMPEKATRRKLGDASRRSEACWAYWTQPGQRTLYRLGSQREAIAASAYQLKL